MPLILYPFYPYRVKILEISWKAKRIWWHTGAHTFTKKFDLGVPTEVIDCAVILKHFFLIFKLVLTSSIPATLVLSWYLKIPLRFPWTETREYEILISLD